jgi:hypothetical protein
MPLIPLKQTITITRSGGVDEWGNTIPTETLTLACRVDEGSQLIVGKSEGTTETKQVVAEAKITLDKLGDVRYTDTIAFTNELGETIERKPKQIDVKRLIGGKPALTVVYV